MVFERLFEERDPFRELADVQRRIGDILEGTRLPGLERWIGARGYPPVNVYLTDSAVVVAAEVPGIDPAQVDISVAQGVLNLSGRRPEQGGEDVSYLRRERQAGEFRRNISLPEPVDSNKAEAHYQKGVLTVVLPRSEEAKPRKIQVKTGKGQSAK